MQQPSHVRSTGPKVSSGLNTKEQSDAILTVQQFVRASAEGSCNPVFPVSCFLEMNTVVKAKPHRVPSTWVGGWSVGASAEGTCSAVFPVFKVLDQKIMVKT